MGRKYRMERELKHSADATWAVLSKAVTACGFDVKKVSHSDRTLHAKKSMKHVSEEMMAMGNSGTRAPVKKTWGEKLTVTVHETQGGCLLDVESRLVFGLIDWDENQRNVEKVHGEVIARLEGLP